MMRFFLFGILLAYTTTVSAQFGPGIGIYPTGTETGLGFRSDKNTRLAFDCRLTRANLYNDPAPSSFVTESNLIYRLVFLEKVRFHMGLGYRADWNFRTGNKHGVCIPIGVEAFPFSFENAGLFFEAAPFGVFGSDDDFHFGVRTVAGLVFYFPEKTKEKSILQ